MSDALSQAEPGARPDRRVPSAAWWLPYLLGWSVFLWIEIDPPTGDFKPLRRPLEWLLAADIDALTWLALLILAPVAWWFGRGEWFGAALRRLGRPIAALVGLAGGRDAVSRTWLCGYSLLVAGISLAASASVGARFDELPPAYHDEYSYLFQAQTFLAGRISFPSHEAAPLFDQMHVLNEGRFASRYFPGTGLWLAPFVAAGHPYWGQWLAGAICAVLIFWIAREAAGDAAGLIAGLLTALSPAMALFSNLLLAHHPTLVGLGLFLLGFLRMIRLASAGWAAVSGIGLTFAMLCRPVTAAAVALPFGVFFVVWAWREARRSRDASGAAPGDGGLPKHDSTAGRGRLLRMGAALGIPLLAGGAGMFFYDRAITGSGWLTPYSEYTAIYTPRHVYGFNNVVRGERSLGPRVIENFDKWAENLTPRMAAENAWLRLTASWKWNLGLLPLTLALAAGFVLWRRLNWQTWLILAGIVVLHAVHVPYWFVGMEDHHYVFESGPLWAVWTAVVSVEAARAWRLADRAVLSFWWGTVLASAVVMNFTVSGGIWSAPVEQGINRVKFARAKHGRFAALVARRAQPQPALVLVEADPSDRHIDYVTNNPNLSGPVLIGHYIPEVVPLATVRRLFPDRSLHLYRVREDEWVRF